MYHYTAYGLRIASELPLRDVIPTGSGNDVTVLLRTSDEYTQVAITQNEQLDQQRRNDLAVWLRQHPECSNGGLADRERATVVIKDVVHFQINYGREVVVAPMEGSDIQRIQLLIVAMILPIVLYQRKLLLLHASAVAINGGVALFIGESGQGKSSTAAALYRNGYSIMTDDVAAITIQENKAFTHPSFPQMKLFDHTAASLGFPADTLRPIHPDEEKFNLRIEGTFFKGPLPLYAIYVLDSGDTHAIEPIAPRSAFQQLIRHSYISLQSLDPLGFNQIMHITRNVPVYRLQRCMDLERLPEVAEIVEAHFAQFEPVSPISMES